MRKVGIGCLGLVVVLFIIVVIAALVAPKPAEQVVSGQPAGSSGTAQLPTVGQTASKGGWEVTLVAFGPYEQFASRPPSTPPQGKLVVAEFTAKNLQNGTSNFTTNDFEIEAGDKRKFQPAGQTASIDKGFVVSQQVQPGLSTDNRVVFDMDPAAENLVLHVLGLQFKLPD